MLINDPHEDYLILFEVQDNQLEERKNLTHLEDMQFVNLQLIYIALK